jgi:hypothetical protein
VQCEGSFATKHDVIFHFLCPFHSCKYVELEQSPVLHSLWKNFLAIKEVIWCFHHILHCRTHFCITVAHFPRKMLRDCILFCDRYFRIVAKSITSRLELSPPLFSLFCYFLSFCIRYPHDLFSDGWYAYYISEWNSVAVSHSNRVFCGFHRHWTRTILFKGNIIYSL